MSASLLSPAWRSWPELMGDAPTVSFVFSTRGGQRDRREEDVEAGLKPREAGADRLGQIRLAIPKLRKGSPLPASLSRGAPPRRPSRR